MQPNQPQSSEEWQTPKEVDRHFSYLNPAYEEVVSEESELQEELTDSGENEVQDGYRRESDEALVRWQGTEYIHQEYPMVWYVVLGIVTIVLMALAYLLMKSVTFMLLIPVMAATLVIYTRRPPAINEYTLSRKGLHVNDRLYSFADFRSFSVIQHPPAPPSVVLVPRKRFQIAQTVYFPEEVGEAIVDMLAARLPMKEGKPDAIDRFLARLRL